MRSEHKTVFWKSCFTNLFLTWLATVQWPSQLGEELQKRKPTKMESLPDSDIGQGIEPGVRFKSQTAETKERISCSSSLGF